MAVEVKVPAVGESVTEGTLARWLRKDGDPVREGDPLFELETDKATSEVPSPASGRLVIRTQNGTTVQVGAVVGLIEAGAAAPAAPKPAPPPPPAPAPAPSQAAPQPKPAPAATGGATVPIRVPAVGESVTEGTLARWLKKDGDTVQEGDALFELETDKATGEVPSPATGRLTIVARAGDTVKVGATVGAITPGAAAPQAPRAPQPAPEVAKPPPAPAVARPQPAPEAAKPQAAPPPAPPASPRERVVRKPMSRLRKTIADRLVQAQHTAAILTTFNEADMTQVLAIRAQHKDEFKKRHGVNLGFMSFFLKAAVSALQAYPVVNHRIEGSDVVEQNYYSIGVAVSTEKGLLVPVIRDCDRLSFAALEKAVEQYAGKAREGKIAVEDLQGGTFTITNGGVFGSLLSTPILNPPQSAILGMHAIQKRPVAIGDKVEIRPMMYLALSYDHRLIDGREAVLFLRHVKDIVENPMQLVWGI